MPNLASRPKYQIQKGQRKSETHDKFSCTLVVGFFSSILYLTLPFPVSFTYVPCTAE